jgi:hypothetical protein
MFLMSHRIHSDLFRVPKSMPDPGNGGEIRVTEDLQILEMVSTGAETRTLKAPTKPGIRFVLRFMTDGGDILVTAENGYNVEGDTVATFNDASDLLQLISVEYTAPTATAPATYRWQVSEGNMGVTISA